MSDARFHPSGTKLVATKWYFSTRSLGAGEGWEYELPSSLLSRSSSTQSQVSPGSGKRLVGRTMPSGWPSSMYEEVQIGPEQFIWGGEDTVIYSKNVIDQGVFEYSKGVCAIIVLFHHLYQLNLILPFNERCPSGNICYLLQESYKRC